MAFQGLFTGGVKIRNLNGYLIAVNGEVFATTNTGGTTYAFFYVAKTTITSGDPGNSHIIWNNATQTSATQINVSHLTDSPVEDIDIYLAAIVPTNRIIIQDRDDSERFQIWTVSGAPTQVGTDYWTIPVTLVQSQGAAFSNNHDLLFAIVSGGSGGGGTTTNAITFNNGGAGAASGTSFNGGVPVTVSYNTIGAQAANANLTSLAGLSYASTAFVKMTGANTFTLDTNTYLTANQTITLSGNVTGSGSTSITTTIANNVVTNAMLAQIATARIRGRVTAGTGNVEDLTGTQATTLLDVFTTSLKGLAPASGGGTTNFLRADGTWAAPPGGTTTNSITFNNGGSGAASGTSFNGSSAVTISHNTIGAQPLATNLTSLAGLTYASGTPFVKMSAAGTFSLDTNTYLTGNQTITLSGDVSGSGATSISTTIGNNAVTLAKFQQISTSSFLGRVTAGTGNVEVLTGTQATTLIDVFTTSLKGLAPASGGGTTNFLRADGTWAAPPGGGGGGTTTFAVTFNNSGTGAASGTTFDGSVARTISYNTLGANKVITSGTAAPTGGVDGDIYLQYDVSLLTGSGTTNYIPKFTSSSAIGNSILVDNNNAVSIGNTASSWRSGANAIQFGTNRYGSLWQQSSGAVDLSFAAYENGTNTFAYTTTGDAPTLYQQVTGNHAWYNAPSGTAGNTITWNERMRITAAGDVGIGTTSPTNKFHVVGNIFADNANGTIIMRNGDATNQQQIRMRMSGNDGILDVTRNSGTAPNLIFGTEATEKMRIDNNGNVGIGTASPANKVDIFTTNRTALNTVGSGLNVNYNGSTTGEFATIGFSWASSIGNNSTRWGMGMVGTNFGAGTGGLNLFTNGSERMRIDESGFVGIGYTAPAARLAVNGTALINTNTDNGVDALQVNGNVTATQYSATVQTLTDGATITFNANNGSNAVVTLGGNRTLAFSNTRTGAYYTLRVIQDGTGGRTLAMPASVRVIGGGGGVVTLSTAANSVDLISFYFDGTNYWTSFGQNYT
ncbi:MAG: hypothetical protein IM591_00240 [Chitinophagaceae bacterium]|nr:hypothetical protein [Chitinophagaceae bacterium]